MGHGDIKDEWDLVLVGDVFWLDPLFGDLVLAVGEDNGQLFSVLLWQLLRDGSSCVYGEITPFHKTEAPRRASAKVADFHFTH